MGAIRFEKGEYSEALHSFEKAVELMPGDFMSWYKLGRTYEKLSRYHNAHAAYLKAEKKAAGEDKRTRLIISNARKRAKRKAAPEEEQ
ncbi:MAG: tetratricopeptide repeat protein [bacterium]